MLEQLRITSNTSAGGVSPLLGMVRLICSSTCISTDQSAGVRSAGIEGGLYSSCFGGSVAVGGPGTSEAAQEIVIKHYVNLGIAAATDRGLVVPSVKDAHALSLPGLAQAINELAETARAGRSTPADLRGGTITITNVGVFGVDTGTPIITPGEAAILSFGQVKAAPWVIDGPINGELFTLYVEKVLAPTLAKGEVVILDNLGSHKGKPARNAIRARGAHLFFLPPYSPDLNPIEQVFAKLKHLLRAAEPRDVEATWRRVGELLDLFSEEECRNYLKNSGYVSE